MKKNKATVLESREEAKKKFSLAKTPLSSEQVLHILRKTPKKHIYQRPAKGGGKWDYVTGVYVKKVLNYVFGWRWDFEVKKHGVEGGTIWVHGRLTVRFPDGDEVVKEQFGRADIKMKRDKSGPLDFGNDLKAATTDALKKCASELGVASDVYGKEEFTQIKVKRLPDLKDGQEPATDGQLKTIAIMGGDADQKLTKQEASELINKLASERKSETKKEEDK